MPLFMLSCCRPECMPPIADPHIKHAEEILEQYESDDIALNHKRIILDILDPENAPHTIEEAKNLA